MKIFALNAGSSSLKFKLLEMPEGIELAEGLVERIGLKDGIVKVEGNDKKIKENVDFPTHKEAINYVIESLTNLGIISSIHEITAVGHRVVHGGEKYTKSIVVTDEVLAGINEVADFAPLHNPANVMGINAFQTISSEIKHVAIFDTAFHQTMPETNFLYGIPNKYYTEMGIRRYGFHGTSHLYVSQKMREINPNADKIITCHLGNGGSLAAIKNGESINTSMGFTPLAGILMGTRSGDIDPSILEYIANKEDLSTTQVTNILNKESGLLGVSGISSDSRDVENAAAEGDKWAIVAENLFYKKVVDYIAQYYFDLEGADAIVFTAGIGENSQLTHKNVIEKLAFLGVTYNEEGFTRGEISKISGDDSTIDIYVIPTNEELVLATDTYELVK